MMVCNHSATYLRINDHYKYKYDAKMTTVINLWKYNSVYWRVVFTYRINYILIYGIFPFQEYSGSTANILTAIFCAVLFPDKFEFTIYIMLSMACLFTGIYLYESRKVTTTSTPILNQNKATSDNK